MNVMLPSSLRIGNWVMRFTRNMKQFICYEQVEKIEKHSMYGELPSSYCEPIALTENIWRKIEGVVYEENRYYFNGLYFYVNGEVFAVQGRPLTIVKYLHELQNLIYIIKRKEIKVIL